MGSDGRRPEERAEVVRVLLIEDVPLDARLIHDALLSADVAGTLGVTFEVETAASLREGMERLDGGAVDVVLLDLTLPDAAGIETLHRLRARAPNLPIVVLTGSSDEALAATAVRDGAQDYLIKGQTDRNLLARALCYARQRIRAEEERARYIREHAAREQAEAAAQRLTVLAGASALLGTSLEFEATLQSLARVAVPSLADWCAVDLEDEEGRLTRVVAIHADAEKEALLHQIEEGYPDKPEDERPTARLMQTGQAKLFEDISDEFLRATSRDADHYALRRALGFKSVMVAPLRARDRLLGAMTFAVGDSRSPYTLSDLTLAEDLASRCALAIDNARLYGEAEQAIRLRDEFLSVAAHELKTPITSLRAYAQLLVREADRGNPLEGAFARRALETIDEQSVKLSRLIGHLLDVSRIEAGKLTLECTATDVTQLVAGLVANARTSTDRHQFELRAEPGVTAVVDPLRLEQVITNLLDNAVKYSPAGGAIEVDVHTEAENEVCISVRDRGVGIPEDQRAHIFDRFYQAHAEGHRSGMGLGLYVSRQIVELHGGRISAGFPEDGGTSLAVHLPARRAVS